MAAWRCEAQAFLNSMTLDQYLSGKPPSTVATVDPGCKLAKALALFARHGILAAPVISEEDSTFHGFLELMDIVSVVVEWVTEGGGGTGRQHLLDAAGERLAATAVSEISRSNDGQMVYRTHGDMPLLEVVRRGFVYPAAKLWCHRLAVFSGESEAEGSTSSGVRITNIVTQIDMIQHVHRHRQRMPTLMGTPISQLPGLLEEAVVGVDHATPVIECFAAMLAGGVTAVAVLRDGELLANLSPSNLRGVQPQHFRQLALPVGEFLEQRAAAGRDWHLMGSPAATYGVRCCAKVARIDPPAACSVSTTVGQALGVLVERGVHRVYLLQPGERVPATPVGVLSTSDLLAALAV